jgi:hypothetical protein
MRGFVQHPAAKAVVGKKIDRTISSLDVFDFGSEGRGVSLAGPRYRGTLASSRVYPVILELDNIFGLIRDSRQRPTMIPMIS